LSGVENSAFADILGKAAWSRTQLLSTGTQYSVETYKQFVRSLFVESTLQDALKVQPSLRPGRKAVEQLCITSYKMMVHMILSYPPDDRRLSEKPFSLRPQSEKQFSPRLPSEKPFSQ